MFSYHQIARGSARGCAAIVFSAAQFPRPESDCRQTPPILKMAEREGFEPSIRFNPYDALAKRCFRPLSHLSGCSALASKAAWIPCVKGFSSGAHAGRLPGQIGPRFFQSFRLASRRLFSAPPPKLDFREHGIALGRRDLVCVSTLAARRAAGHVSRVQERVEYPERRAGPERRPMGKCELLVFAFHPQGHLCSV